MTLLPVPLGDETVTLRPARPDDDPRIVEACTDPETVRWLGQLPQPYGPQQAAEWRSHMVEEARAGRRTGWIVADPATDRLMGAIDLFAVREGWDGEVGYWSHPEARGRGVMTAATRLLVAHAFRPVERGGVGLVRLQAITAVGNDASAALLLRVGFRRAGLYRAFVSTRQGRSDAVLYDLLLDDVRSSGQSGVTG